ncbi:hypothetical protein BDN70DRAFT_804032 [Pholiota conissans]|uniref:BTB domain-containing protein n=1 Tax=Pholiota conissans TaxID=109636 RepID=A0A9P5Z6V4_9AGAR|nr:hypothetical protein BDN70DRAFT_804032 [Pholiota conissans]
METEGPPRKRPRNDTNESDEPDTKGADAAVPEIEDITPPTRDETYYRADGDCVIRVEDVLFKVHRFLLVRDSAVFRDMFSMPQGSEEPSQITTDEDPVVLHDDVDDFRALCWGVYALPTEYMEQADESKVDIDIIACLYLIAQKYQFESHEKYARDLLKSHCTNVKDKPAAIKEFFIRKCPSTCLASLLKISLLADDPHIDSSLASALQKAWLFRLQARPDSSPSYAISVAENLGLRKFMGELYYHHMISSIPDQMEDSEVYERPDEDLEPHQRLPFYQGYMSLQLYWSDFMKGSRRKFKCPHGCNRVWTEFWPRFKLDLVGYHFDPRTSMNAFLKNIIKANKETYLETNISCITTYINDRIKEFDTNLADHFLGPVPSQPPIEID